MFTPAGRNPRQRIAAGLDRPLAEDLSVRLSRLAMIVAVTAPLASALAPSLASAQAEAQAAPPPFTLAAGRDHPLAGKVWSSAAGAFVEPAEVARWVARARFVLLGEIHDNRDHHALQAHLVGAAARERRPALVLEMLTRDLQPAVSAYLAAGGSAAGFGEAVGWADLGWPDYAIYRPILEQAVANGLAVVAADTPRAERRRVAQEGAAALGAERAAALALDRPLPEPARDLLLDELEAGHCGLMPRERLAPMLIVQRLRDATLADALLSAEARDGQGAVLIAGTGHTRRDLGVPWYLAAREPQRPSGPTEDGQPADGIVAVAFVEVVEGRTEPTAYAEAAGHDVMWFTPRAERADPCEELRKQFGTSGG